MNSVKNLETDMYAFFEKTPDLVCIASRDGYFKKVNRAVVEKLGYPEEEIYRLPISHFMHPEDREHTLRGRERLLNGDALINFQNRYVARSGRVLWLDWTSIYFSDKELVFAIAKDITERKRLEKEIEEKYRKFRGLANHFKSSIEEDRKNMAVELHEELAQLVSVVKMDVDWIRDNQVDVSGAAKERLNHALAVCDLLITTIRRISFSLSPQMLEQFGLYETITRLCSDFELLTGISCGLEIDCEEDLLPAEVQLDFFRICQEALRNIMDYAEANNVRISLGQDDCSIWLSIVDDGKWMMAEDERWRNGMTEIRERAASIDGEITISREQERGMRVFVTVPQTIRQRV